jgi:uncharacterized peroxidase-related enzyme
MANIKVIDYEESDGKLREIYDDLIKSRGKLAEVHKIQSLNPESIVNHMDLYMTVMFGKSPLRRVQREMIAVIVSVANECKYCTKHHIEAVSHFWKDTEKCRLLIEDYKSAGLKANELALCDYARTLTLDPGVANDSDLTNALREAGLEDRAILDATLVVSYFNFVNRIVLSLGVDLESNSGGYKYE